MAWTKQELNGHVKIDAVDRPDLRASIDCCKGFDDLLLNSHEKESDEMSRTQ